MVVATLPGTSQAEGVCRHPGARLLWQKCVVPLLKMKGAAYGDSVLPLPSAELRRGHGGNVVKRKS